MIRLLSVGVASCVCGGHLALPCAIKDAELIYNAFSESFYGDFDHLRSHILVNPTRSILVAAVGAQAASLSADDIFVLYVSSHGDMIGSRLEIQLHDYEEGKFSGSVTPEELDLLFLKACFKSKIFILDCCYSGLAGAVSEFDGYKRSATAIITSAAKNREAAFDSEGSLFTKYLAKSIYSTREDAKASLSLIFDYAEEMTKKDSLDQTPLIFLPDGVKDVVLNSRSEEMGVDENNEQMLADKIRNSSRCERKNIWNSLPLYGEKVFFSVLDFYLKDNLESLWDVRRAIGNSLASIKYLTEQQKTFCGKLLSPTSHWTNQCIGVIGSRYLPELDMRESYLEILTRSVPVELKWLVLLYYTDKLSSFVEAEFRLFLSAFSNTTWGALEVWARFYKSMPKEFLKEAIDLMLACPCLQDSRKKNDFLLHLSIYFSNDVEEILNDSGIELVQSYDSDFLDIVKGLSPRGVLHTSGLSKWVHSLLYGTWRDDTTFAMSRILSALNREMFVQFSNNLKNFSSASLQVAFFESLNLTKQPPELIFENMQWGLLSPHPWVNRATISSFYSMFYLLSSQSKGLLKELLQTSFVTVDDKLYPGCLDLMFFYSKLYSLMSLSAEDIPRSYKECFGSVSPDEKRSLAICLNSEGIDLASLVS
ncbi:caspase family protein [Solidesulfovibrio carbinolicus]|uniref:caspase family protein n=1 Tax=Solidesulfovibrio carbinolicus TaxID=296842 RepID=UPI0010133F53|nr:caspase family protein [Solidesulfovibrio carbinolicus]